MHTHTEKHTDTYTLKHTCTTHMHPPTVTQTCTHTHRHARTHTQIQKPQRSLRSARLPKLRALCSLSCVVDCLESQYFQSIYSTLIPLQGVILHGQPYCVTPGTSVDFPVIKSFLEKQKSGLYIIFSLVGFFIPIGSLFRLVTAIFSLEGFFFGCSVFFFFLTEQRKFRNPNKYLFIIFHGSREDVTTNTVLTAQICSLSIQENYHLRNFHDC